MQERRYFVVTASFVAAALLLLNLFLVEVNRVSHDERSAGQSFLSNQQRRIAHMSSGRVVRRVRLAAMPAQELEKAVVEFNARYGEMENVLWCLSQHCRGPLLEGEPSPLLSTLIWTIKSWWGVQGVRSETKDLMARALASLDWSEDHFVPPAVMAAGSASFAADLVASLVERTQERGAPRREYSLASKVLHWLLPWHVPVYDSFVRKSVGVPDAWDHPQAYRRIVREVFEATTAVSIRDPGWVGELEPRSPLRAFDKCLWWFGGGDAATAVEVKQPWRVVDQLGLPRL